MSVLSRPLSGSQRVYLSEHVVPRSVEDPQEAKARDRARICTHRGDHRLAQARHVGADPLPTTPDAPRVLRANPYPEVMDPIFQLPLPTLVLSTRGSSAWRPAVDMATSRRDASATS